MVFEEEKKKRCGKKAHYFMCVCVCQNLLFSCRQTTWIRVLGRDTGHRECKYKLFYMLLYSENKK